MWRADPGETAIERLQNLRPGPGPWLACIQERIQERIQELRKHEVSIHILWAPGHESIEGNKRADQAAKEAAKEAATRGTCTRDKFTSLSHMTRLITELKWKECHKWFKLVHRKRKSNSRSA